MPRPNLVIILCFFLFLSNVGILNAQIQLGKAHIANAHFWSDPCAGKPIGGTCTDGAIYAGTGYSSGGLNPALRYMVTPGGCTTETCVGAGGTDSISRGWANGSGTTANGVVTGAADLNNGKLDTVILVNYSPFYSDTDAAHWCTNMNYGGYTNWYLPSQNELNYVLYANAAVLGGFNTVSAYWSSSEFNSTNAWFEGFNIGNQANSNKPTFLWVRCIRSY